MKEYLSSQLRKGEEISRRTTRGSQMLNILLFKTASGQRTFLRIVILELLNRYLLLNVT